jgi:valyl-tRNA synthetase
MESSRAFANKIWNAARFFTVTQASGLPSDGPMPIEDRWIFSRLNATAEAANRAIDQYRYHEFAQLLWHFFWHEFCDWYIELKKVPGASLHNAIPALDTALRLLHPAMPFLTEELWQRLEIPDRPKSIALAPYPQYRDELADPEAEKEIAILQDVVTMARTLRTEAKLDPKQQLEGTLYCRTSSLAIAERHAAAIRRLANVQFTFKSDAAPKSAAMRSTAEFDVVLHVPAAQEETRRKRVERELEQLEKNIANIERQLSDEVFLSKAPAKVIETLRAKLADYKAQREKLL